MSIIIVFLFDLLIWKQVDIDVYVVICGGEFVGFVEFDGVVYFVCDNCGIEFGVFDFFDDVFCVFEEVYELVWCEFVFMLILL